jgi:hypothetical protein
VQVARQVRRHPGWSDVWCMCCLDMALATCSCVFLGVGVRLRLQMDLAAPRCQRSDAQQQGSRGKPRRGRGGAASAGRSGGPAAGRVTQHRPAQRFGPGRQPSVLPACSDADC